MGLAAGGGAGRRGGRTAAVLMLLLSSSLRAVEWRDAVRAERVMEAG